MSKHRHPNRTLLPLYQSAAPPPQADSARKSFETPSRSRSGSFTRPTLTRSRSSDSTNRQSRRRRNSLSSSSNRDSYILPSHISPGTTPARRQSSSSPIRPRPLGAPNSGNRRIIHDCLFGIKRTMAGGPTPTQQQEQLPDPAPFPTFFMPNFLGAVFAYGLESFNAEKLIGNYVLSNTAHRYALLGLGVFAIAMTNSYLGGSVVLARLQYNVKLPNLYSTSKDKDGVAFNCVQRGHQNFIETYAQVVLSALFVALIVPRPNIAGMMLITIAIARVLYAKSYRTNIPSRIGPLLIAIFTMSIGVGYGFLLALSMFGIQIINE